MTDFSMTDSPYEPIFRVGTLLAPPLFITQPLGAPAHSLMECLRPALKKRKRYCPGDLDELLGLGSATPVTPAGAPASDTAGQIPGVTPKSVTFPRGSKCQRVVGSADPKIDRTPIDLPCHCDGCGRYILTARHNCKACEDYDLCAPCFVSLEGDGGLQHEHGAESFEVQDWTEEEEELALREAIDAMAGHATPATTGGARPIDREREEDVGGGGGQALVFLTPIGSTQGSTPGATDAACEDRPRAEDTTTNVSASSQ